MSRPSRRPALLFLKFSQRPREKAVIPTLGDDPRAYSAEALRAFVLDRARPHGIYRAKSIVVAVRSFVRFLGVTGRCPPGMEHAIPGFTSWELSSVPRFLVAEDVERVIAGKRTTGRPRP